MMPVFKMSALWQILGGWHGKGDYILENTIKKKRKKSDKNIAVLFLLPSLVLLALFVFWPMVDSIRMSFYDWNPLKGSNFNGIDNYVELMQDDLWWTSLKNTVVYILMNVPPIVIFAIIMTELVLFANKRNSILSKLVRGVFFLPCALSLVATGVAWRFLMGTNYGVINSFLGLFGIPDIGWLTDGKVALASMAIVTVWRWAGYYMVMVVAGRLEISKEYYEAADLDGANAWHKFISITLPQLKPVLTYIILMCVIGTFQEFDLVYTMTNGGPGTSTYLTGFTLYQTAFSSLKMGYSCAMAVFIFLLSIVISVLQLKLTSDKD